MSFDEQDWNRPVMGSGARDTVLERRSLISNDDGILNGTVPDNFYPAGINRGKFFTRGCRGMIEELQLYCIGDAADEITLRYSPHPGIGPFGEVTIVPAAAWAWQAFVIEEMWNYDSLFIWVYEAEVNVDWAYDAEQPYDAHSTPDFGVTWRDRAFRYFIRVVYTGETPGDVPVSGILNTIPIPSQSSQLAVESKAVPQNVETLIVEVEGAGYCDYIEVAVHASASAEHTTILVYCDDVLAMVEGISFIASAGHTTSTPTVSLSLFTEDGQCHLLIHKRFEFRRKIEVRAENTLAAVTVSVWIHPALMR